MAREKGLPENLEFERLVLGSAMLDQELIHAMRPVLEVEDFSLEKHRRIWKRVCGLYDSGRAVDRTTVYAELLKFGEAASCDGLSYLVSLDDGLPRLPNVDAYVQGVKDKALLRNVFFACQHLQNRCMEGIETPQQILDGAAQTIMQLSPQQVGCGLRSAAEIIDAVGLSAILRSRRESGLLFPWPWMNYRTGGMLPAELWVLAGYTSSGKTSAMLQHAVTAARRGLGVAIFSLEVGAEALLKKAIHQFGRIDSESANRGTLDAEQKSAENSAATEIHDMPLYLDTQSTTTMAIHAALRRLRLKHRVDHVIVDYLQLLGNSGKYDNRAQAVGANAWALKMLATEFKIPVLLLSQFARQQGNKSGQTREPELSDLKECVTGDTRVVDADSGRMLCVKDMIGGNPYRILGCDKRQRLRVFTAERVWSTGIREVFALRTRTGRTVRATGNHPFLTPNGWKPLSELKSGDGIATAKRIFDVGTEVKENADLCRLLGYLVGDGSYLNHSSISFISADRKVFEDAGSIIKQHWPTLTHTPCEHPEGYFATYYTQLFENGYGKPHGNPMREWLRGLGIYGCRESNKRVPDFVFESGIVAAYEFLAGYLATDGCVKFSKQHPRAEVQFDSTSSGLLEDVQLLLLKIGVVSTLNRGVWNTKSSKPIYRLTVSIVDSNIRRFAAVPARGKKGRMLQEILNRPPKKETGGGLFNLPVEISELCWERSGGKKYGGWTHQGKTMRRSSAKQWSMKHNDREVLMWAESDLLWEPIASIQPAGTEEVFDLSVPGCGNFIANGIVAHNSGDIENHANGVWFIHRASNEDSNQVPVKFMLPKQRDGRRNVYQDFWFFPNYQRFEQVSNEEYSE
jgi:replicative DNA helicase